MERATATREESTPDQAPGVERTDDVPVGVQLTWRLRALIKSGQIAAGARLPGVRELAAGAGVNVNTARTVYRRLEREGLAVSRQGLGTFVAEHASVSPALEQLATDAAEAASELGLEPRELARTLYAASSPESPGAPGEVADDGAPPVELDQGSEITEVETDDRAARRTLRAQIARLEAELVAYPESGEGKMSAPRPARPVIADIAELESVRNELIARVKRAREDAERRGRRQSAARAHLEKMVSDPTEHKWEVVSNEDLGEPGCTSWEVRPAAGPVGALMNWWRVKISSGCPLAG